MNNNYYEYCKAIAKPYYPKIYNDINKSIEIILKGFDKDKLYPFPNVNDFKDLVNKIFYEYKKSMYKEILEGKVCGIDCSDYNVTNIMKDTISILLIQKIIDSRKSFIRYPYYY